MVFAEHGTFKQTRNCGRWFLKKKKLPLDISRSTERGRMLWTCCVCRPGVRLSDAEAPVHVRRQQQPPGARWEDTEHLVAAPGARPEGTVRGATCDTHTGTRARVRTPHGFLNQAISIHDVPTYKKKIMASLRA